MHSLCRLWLAAYLTRQDCAHAAAGALLHALPESSIWAYSQTGIAAIVSEITGKPLVYQDVAPEQRKAEPLAAVLLQNMPSHS